MTYYCTKQLLALCWCYVVNLNKLPLTWMWLGKKNDRKLHQFSSQDRPLRFCVISVSRRGMISAMVKAFAYLISKALLPWDFHKLMLWREYCCEVLLCDLGQITSLGLSSSTRKIKSMRSLNVHPALQLSGLLILRLPKMKIKNRKPTEQPGQPGWRVAVKGSYMGGHHLCGVHSCSQLLTPSPEEDYTSLASATWRLLERIFPSSTDKRFGHVTCFAQWNVTDTMYGDISRGVRRASEGFWDLLLSSVCHEDRGHWRFWGSQEDTAQGVESEWKQGCRWHEDRKRTFATAATETWRSFHALSLT